MKRSQLVSALALSALAIGSILTGGCLAPTDAADADEATPSEQPAATLGGPHLMLTDQARAALPEVKAERAAQTLTYYGGPVVQNINVIPVYWNSKVQYQSNLSAFYGAIVTGAEMSFLSQYSTSSPKQTIGNGTRGTPVVDTQTSTKVTDTQIHTYLTGKFNAGTLPKPTNNTYYPIHFPAGVSISDGSSSKSCVQFCAYHGTYVYNGQDVYYGVLPDLSQSGCAGGCGGSTVLNNSTSVASHEFAETVTDAAVGLATTLSPPLAWYNNTYGEIGDICNGEQTTATLGDGKSYTVQKLWSNSASACVTP